MADRSPWWKFLTGRNENTLKKVQQEFGNSDNTSVEQTGTENKSNSLISDETYDDSQLQPTFNENSSRRNWTESRSGRFKEKRKIRLTLPENNFFERNMAVAK